MLEMFKKLWSKLFSQTETESCQSCSCSCEPASIPEDRRSHIEQLSEKLYKVEEPQPVDPPAVVPPSFTAAVTPTEAPKAVVKPKRPRKIPVTLAEVIKEEMPVKATTKRSKKKDAWPWPTAESVAKKSKKARSKK